MTPLSIPREFARNMGCTAAELQAWLLRALPGSSLAIDERSGHCEALWPWGRLFIRWQPGPPRQIALLRIPTLLVHFRFEGASDEERYQVMRRFDLETHRGGG